MKTLLTSPSGACIHWDVSYRRPSYPYFKISQCTPNDLDAVNVIKEADEDSKVAFSPWRSERGPRAFQTTISWPGTSSL